MTVGEKENERDFKWKELMQEIESKPSFSYHFLPFQSSPSSSSSSSLSLLIPMHGNASTLVHSPASSSSGNVNIMVYACDCSAEALEITKEFIDTADGVSLKQQFHPFHCDISKSGIPKWLRCDSCQENHALRKKDHSAPHLYRSFAFFFPPIWKINSRCINDLASLEGSTCCIGVIDFLTLIFTLLAIPFQIMPLLLTECFSVLKPGGLLLFRNYDQRVGFGEYMHSDGTRSYFFSLDTVRGLFVMELEYCCIKSMSRRNGKCMKRVWVHGKFQKPELLS
ncbi:hypothetical protein RJ641_020485 [Dillenia turbinata]|uniref:Methyltransferase-like protein n=1 Tax=Dillenia turbinata TaxID=194707 RepID=A0AAN8UEN7_9MAGN